MTRSLSSLLGKRPFEILIASRFGKRCLPCMMNKRIARIGYCESLKLHADSETSRQIEG